MLNTENIFHPTRKPAFVISQTKPRPIRVEQPKNEIIKHTLQKLRAAGSLRSWLILALLTQVIVLAVRNYAIYGFER
jgi:hypothetical protein